MHEYLRTDALLASQSSQSIPEVAAVSDGNHFSISEDFVEDGVPYYRGQDAVGHVFIEQSAPYQISQHAFNQTFMRRSHLKEGDVLLSIVGTIGEVSLVTSPRPATCSCKLAILRPKTISAEYLVTFLRSKTGRSLTKRWTRGAVQKGLLLEDLFQLAVPRWKLGLEAAVRNLVSSARAAEERFQQLGQSAEELLAERIGLSNWMPAGDLIYERDLREVDAAARIDALYFTPDKTELLKRLKVLSEGTLGDFLSSERNTFNPRDAHKPFPVRNFDLSDAYGGYLLPKPTISSAELGSTKKFLQNDDVVISRLRSYLREIAVVRHVEGSQPVASTEFIVLRRRSGKQLAPEALWVYLRSKPVQFILRCCVDGSQHPRFSEVDLLSIPLPRVVYEQASELTSLFRVAEAARERSAYLLKRATQAIDVALEQGEGAALRFLKEAGTS